MPRGTPGCLYKMADLAIFFFCLADQHFGKQQTHGGVHQDKMFRTTPIEHKLNSFILKKFAYNPPEATKNISLYDNPKK